MGTDLLSIFKKADLKEVGKTTGNIISLALKSNKKTGAKIARAVLDDGSTLTMQLPEGYEAHIVPRSSTFRKWGILQANSMGVIDESYCGDDDVWGFPALAMRDTTIARGDRICQFRVMRKMDKPELVTVEHLDNASRGGFGSTGTR